MRINLFCSSQIVEDYFIEEIYKKRLIRTFQGHKQP